jgi:hypothetical protein
MQQRMERIEQTCNRHDDQIARLFSKIDSTDSHLQDIRNSLLQLKFGFIGALAYFVLTEIGFSEGLKLIT